MKRSLAVIDALVWPAVVGLMCVWKSEGALAGPAILFCGVWALRRLSRALDNDGGGGWLVGLSLGPLFVGKQTEHRGEYTSTTGFVVRLATMAAIVGFVGGGLAWLLG
jgi:hypothetical protein